MENDIIKQVLDFIERTGSALIQAGFAISLKYVIASAIVDTVMLIISIVLSILFIREILKLMDKVDKSRNADLSNVEAATLIICIILSIVSAISTLAYMASNPIKVLLAPEWYAILNIIDVVK